jgi:hypothetical protein
MTDDRCVGEELVFALEPDHSAVLGEAAGEDDTSPLTGEIDFSLCPSGNGSAPCPFYLGHLEVVATEDLEVEVTCPDASSETFDLENLVLRLAQPAFGIDDLVSVRWYVDDVLMSASTTSLAFTAAQELRAVATDARGARTTATKTIACN